MYTLCWPYPSFESIADQVDCLSAILRESGSFLSISRQLSLVHHNILVDGISLHRAVKLIEDLEFHDLEVSLMVTEFLETRDLEATRLNGAPIDSLSAVWQDRLSAMRVLSPYIRQVISVGGQPECGPYAEWLGADESYSLGFPAMPNGVVENSGPWEYEFHFSGEMTPFREQVLAALRAAGHSIICQTAFESQRQRVQLAMRARFGLNIPQSPTWPWISTMRLYFYRQLGKHVFHFDSSGGHAQAVARGVPFLRFVQTEAFPESANLLRIEVTPYAPFLRDQELFLEATGALRKH